MILAHSEVIQVISLCISSFVIGLNVGLWFIRRIP